MKKNAKQVLTAITLILMMILTALAPNIPSTSAADYPTWMFLTVQPDPIGVGQDANVVYWIDKAPPTASGPRGDRWQNWKMEITSPDGDIETINLAASDAAGSGIIKYTPTQIGNYYLQSHFSRTEHNTGQCNQLVQTKRKRKSPTNSTRRTNPTCTLQSATNRILEKTNKRCKPRLESSLQATGLQAAVSWTTWTTML